MATKADKPAKDVARRNLAERLTTRAADELVVDRVGRGPRLSLTFGQPRQG